MADGKTEYAVVADALRGRILSGKLKPGELADFKQMLGKSQELQQEVESHRHLQAGLHVYEQAAAEHIRSDLLAAFAVRPDTVDKKEKDRIQQHLAVCSACRQDLSICARPADPRPSGWLASSLHWLLSPAARPALVAALVVLVAIPILYVGFRQPSSRQATVTFTVTPVSRDIRSLNDIGIPDSADSVRLEFLIPVPENTDLQCVLIDDTGRIIHEWTHGGPQNPFALELPKVYFDAGIYNLKVREVGRETVDDWFVFRLQVQLD